MIHDAAVGFHQGFGVEGRLSVEHLVHAHAQRPPVTFRAVASLAVLHRLETSIAHITTTTKKERKKKEKLRKHENTIRRLVSNAKLSVAHHNNSTMQKGKNMYKIKSTVFGTEYVLQYINLKLAPF